jgi:peptide methionine sulfoxide reductase msrA/msrB
MKKNIINIIILTLFMMTAGCAVSDSNIKSDGAAEKESLEVIGSQKEDPLKNDTNDEGSVTKKENSDSDPLMIVPDYRNSRYKEIYLAGGCFWGIQAYIDRIGGVEYTNVGYANGNSPETDYSSIKKTGHAETVYVVYDPEKISLGELLKHYYGVIDPTSLNQQGNDRGTQYRSGIYYVDGEDRRVIESSTADEQTKYSEKIVTEIGPLKNYVPAEEYHQNYLEKNPGGYCHIDLSKIPGEKPQVNLADYPRPSIEEIKEKLTDQQFGITQENATEYAFGNKYWDNKEAGLYVDIVTGQPLFLSLDKFDSGTGWPSFTRPIQWDVVTYQTDRSGGMERIEVRSRGGDSHLGHLFYDGPVEEGGLRYCINSGALDFIPLDELGEREYGKFRILFE